MHRIASPALRNNLLYSAAVLFTAVNVIFASTTTFALSEYNTSKYAHNNIMFYDPDDTGLNGCRQASSAPNGDNVTWIGDSLSEQSATLREISSKVGADMSEKTYDGSTYKMARYSRKFASDVTLTGGETNHSGLNVARALVDHGDMKDYLVFALGTNDQGTVNEEEINQLVQIVGSNTKIVLVTNYGLHTASYSTNNAAMHAAESADLVVADWYTAALSDPSGYIDDSDGLGVHLTAAGSTAFVDVVVEALKKFDTSGSTAASSGDNTNYAGATVFSEGELQKIEENRPFYEDAAATYGIPWQLIAVIHSTEHGLQRDNPANGQGAYQLYSYTGGGTNSNAFLPAGPISDTEFARQTNIAAEIISNMITNGGYGFDSEEGVKYLLFSYNGRASQYIQKAKDMGFSDDEAAIGEGSAYVMNRVDARRDPTSDQMDPRWPGRFVGDGHYDPTSTTTGFGTYVKYLAIGGVGGGGTCSSSNSGDFAEFILKHAWPEYHSGPYLDRMPAYAQLVSRRQSASLYVGGSVRGVAGIDCGGWVTSALNESGFDPEYNYGGKISAGASNVTYGQLKWLKENPDKWERVNPAWNVAISSESELSPGDVGFDDCSSEWNCGHTFLYVGEIEGFGAHIASASYSSTGNGGRAPMAGYEPIFSDGYGVVQWYHKK